jgi:glycolate dehydrogenase FAD-binding subunit
MMTPSSETDLAEIIAGAQGPLSIRGGGTRGLLVAGEPLSTAEIAGVELYEPGALTLVAKAGTPVSYVNAKLAAENQRLAFEPMDHRGLLGTDGQSTIGAVVAANVSGPRRIQVGAARDFALGVRYVDGSGQVVKNGGRVMKNVTGYDLVKLMAGAHGTLGVLTEVSLKVLPKPEMAACLLIDGLSVEAAVRAMSTALGSPYEVTGAAHAPVGLDGLPVTMIRIEGFESSVSYRLGELKKLIGDAVQTRVETDQTRVEDGWRWVRDVELFHGQVGDVWRVSVKPSDAPRAVAEIGAGSVLLDWGGGLIWALVPEGQDLRARMTGAGHATLVRASDQTRRRLGAFHPQPAPLAALSAGLRGRFDPRGILNTGLMG